ncbi:hypothetical protein AZE42_10043 [Rhizopogon vesiculosus]|uniref:Uncharacterized protein n=1 Tax=Rhizopogon vesiculosus TaxID=180088 RepID=A0A1J8PT57_9AGAM|nr:hypothetical protein AZE42_10043 [Rhizopogon vesiculosus]
MYNDGTNQNTLTALDTYLSYMQ